MEKLRLNSYKIASKLPLPKIAEFFRYQRPLSWQEHIILEGSNLDWILKYHTTGKQVYLFQFGCITFVNFDAGETRTFLHILESIIGKIDYNLFYKYYEMHDLELEGNEMCRLWKGRNELTPFKPEAVYVTALVLAKSAALNNIEVDITSLQDEAENFIFYLSKGKLHANSKSFLEITARLLRFKYDSVNNIRIFERSALVEQNLYAREVYDNLAEYYELSGRYNRLDSKIKDLHRITESYSNLSYSNTESKQYIYTIILLVLFLVPYFFKFLIKP